MLFEPNEIYKLLKCEYEYTCTKHQLSEGHTWQSLTKDDGNTRYYNNLSWSKIIDYVTQYTHTPSPLSDEPNSAVKINNNEHEALPDYIADDCNVDYDNDGDVAAAADDDDCGKIIHLEFRFVFVTFFLSSFLHAFP